MELKRLCILAACATAVMISACANPLTGAAAGSGSISGTGTGDQTISLGSPVSTGSTLTDEKGLYAIESGYKLVLSTTDHALNVGLLTPGSPTALKIEAGLDKVGSYIRAAETAQAALNRADLSAQLSLARDALRQIVGLIPGLPKTIPGL